MQTVPFCAGSLDQARVLVVGHDPRLQSSDTQAEYAFFADYLFKPRPQKSSEAAKYNLAEATFKYIRYLTSQRYTDDQIVLTNLCNSGLPHAPKGKTVLIPPNQAQAGINAIDDILNQSQIEVIFVMSQQVNYWLQALGFYPPVAEYLRLSEPKRRGLTNVPPYYEPQHGKAFQLICGRCFKKDTRSVVPILHIKNWPLRGALKEAYRHVYDDWIDRLGTE